MQRIYVIIAALLMFTTTMHITHPAKTLADGIPGIGPVGKVAEVKGGFKFTEGPAWDGKGNLYFTDIPANKIYKLDANGKLGVFLEPSGHCNGLMFHGPNTLLACVKTLAQVPETFVV